MPVATPPTGDRCRLEEFTRCSDSLLWKLMMSFYDRNGVESWSQGIVPHFITCNAFIGRLERRYNAKILFQLAKLGAYAKVLLGFLHDCTCANSKIPLNKTEPLYIIELGAGSGKFSFFILQAIKELPEVFEFPAEKVVYVMTDFTWNNLKFWNDHESFRPYLDCGQLDIAIFDAVHDETIRLHHSNVVIGRSTLKNPICVIANYLFDTLCHDIFQIEAGQLKEGLISVGSRNLFETDPLDPEIIKRFDNHFTYRVINENYYAESEPEDSRHLRRILRWYRDFFGDASDEASILLPIGALRALRRLTSFSCEQFWCMAFRGLNDPHVAVHGSFSVMVNYHAIGLYCTSRSGFVLHDPQEEASLKVSVLVFTNREDAVLATFQPSTMGHQSSPFHDLGRVQIHNWIGSDVERLSAARSLAFPNLCRAFSDSITSFGPNDFFVVQKSMKDDTERPTLKAIVALLKLSNWDPDVFYKFRDPILQQVSACTIKLRNDLCRNLPQLWRQHFMLDKNKDVAFEVGRLYYGLRMYQKAIRFYQTSIECSGEHHVTFHNMGLCYYSLSQYQLAFHHFGKALLLKNDYTKARAWQDKLHREKPYQFEDLN